MEQTVDLAPEAARYLPLVKSIALQLKKKLPSNIELDDLIGYGTIGLMQAVKSFQTGKGTVFKTFAFYRIRGAMYDGLRKIGWLSRSAYAEYKLSQKSNEVIQDHVTSAEGVVKRTLEAEAGELKQVLQSLVPVCLLSMEAVDRILADRKGDSPEAELLEKQTKERISAVLESLEERERLLVQYYYFEDFSLEEAGEKLGISRSWASRLHLKALGKMKAALVGQKKVA